MNQSIISLVSFQARDGAGEELGRCLGTLVLQARGDEGCQRCELVREPGVDQDWLLRGWWECEQALELHLQQPHMQLLGQWMESGLIRRMAMRLESAEELSRS